MRLEDVSPGNVGLLGDSELANLRSRAEQLYRSGRKWKDALRKRMVGVTQPIETDVLVEAYEMLSSEARRRNLELSDTDLDRKRFRKRVRGIDAEDLPAVVVRDRVVVVGGRFVTNPKAADVVNVHVDADEFDDPDFTALLEKRLADELCRQTNRPVCVRRDALGIGESVLPLYDLVLVPRLETKDDGEVKELIERLGEPIEEGGETDNEERIMKPYPNEHAARQMSPSGCDDITSGKPKGWPDGVRALYCIKGGKSKIQSVRFKADKWTAEQAKDWLKERGLKTGEFEPAVKKGDTGVEFVKVDEDRHLIGGIVYHSGPDAPADTEGDYVDSEEELFEAMKSWMINGQAMKIMHKGRTKEIPLVECFQAEADTKKGGKRVPKGAWYITNYVPDDDLWQAIKDGEITGYSMGGRGRAEEVA